MELNTRLSQREYINASLTILYRKPAYFIMVLLMILLLIVNVCLFVMGYLPDLGLNVFPVILLFVTPFSTFMAARRAYKYNKAASSPIVYEFTETQLNVNGAGFHTEKHISELRKVFKTKNWLFIMNASKAVNPIPLEQVSSQQLQELKTILDANQVRNNL